jgi:hypothetical protein
VASNSFVGNAEGVKSKAVTSNSFLGSIAEGLESKAVASNSFGVEGVESKAVASNSFGSDEEGIESNAVRPLIHCAAMWSV